MAYPKAPRAHSPARTAGAGPPNKAMYRGYWPGQRLATIYDVTNTLCVDSTPKVMCSEQWKVLVTELAQESKPRIKVVLSYSDEDATR